MYEVSREWSVVSSSGELARIREMGYRVPPAGRTILEGVATAHSGWPHEKAESREGSGSPIMLRMSVDSRCGPVREPRVRGV